MRLVPNWEMSAISQPLLNQKTCDQKLSPLISHHLIMDFATPWAPTLNGNNLNPCVLVSDLVENDE
jgi:hypothetical protein